MPLINYAVVPMDGRDAQLQDEMNAATKLAAADLLNNPAWHDRTVVVVWEHLNIASTRLERQNSGVPGPFASFSTSTCIGCPREMGGQQLRLLLGCRL